MPRYYPETLCQWAYSKKLGQVFDSFKYKIKKELIEKQKEAKQ